MKTGSGKSTPNKSKRAKSPQKKAAQHDDNEVKGVDQAAPVTTTAVSFEALRFAHFQPQAIETMAVTQDRQLVAVARENNSIEIWLRESWVQLMVIPGNKLCAIRNVHWLEKSAASSGSEGNPLMVGGQSRRLITTGLNGVVIEWDLLTQEAKTKHSVNAAIWCSKIVGKNLYLACEDGTIKLLKVKKDNIELARQFMRAETKCLSLEVTADEKFIFGGYADSSIRKWNLQTLSCDLHFVKQTKKAANRISDKGDQCLIWTLKLFGDDTLFSGDSHGDLTVWDTTHGTLVQTFNMLKADITCIEANEARGIVFATGVDARILSVQKNQEQWVFLSLYRGQSHDIKSLIQLDQNELISAGVNTDICIYKLDQNGTLGDQYGKESIQQKTAAKLRHVPPFPQNTPIRYADGLILLQNANNQHLQLLSQDTNDEVLRIEKSGDYGIGQVAFDGRYIAYSDCKETQIFSFDKEVLKLRKLTRKICSLAGVDKLPSASFLAIQPAADGKAEQLIMVTKELQVCTIDLQSHEISQVCDKAVFEGQSTTEMRYYDQIVTVGHYNSASNRLVLSFANQAFFSVIDLAEKDSLYWRLPSLNNLGAPIVFASDFDKLLVGYDSNHVAVFDLLNKQIHPWTQQNLSRLPRNFLNRYNKFAGAIQISDQKFLLYTSYTFCTLDLSQDLPQTVEMVLNHPTKTPEGRQFNAATWQDNLKLSQAKYLTHSDARGTSAQPASTNLAINNRFKGIMLMDYNTADKKLKVFEHSWKQAIGGFQAGAFVHKKFGQ